MNIMTAIIAIRVALFLLCLGLFLLQSYQEMLKYASGVTSTAISTFIDNNVSYPIMAVCASKVYREVGRITTMERYLEMTYTAEEIVMLDKLEPGREYFNISSWYTYHYGLCVLLRPHETIHYTDWVKIRAKLKVKVFLLAEHQELCLVMADCNRELAVVPTVDEKTVVKLRVKRKLWPEE